MRLLSYALLVAALVAPGLGAQDKEKDRKDKTKDKAAKSADNTKDKDKAAAKAAETPYYPLQVGNTWNYRAGENRFAMRVAKHEKVGDTMTARVEMLVDGKVRSSENIGVTADGVYRYAYSTTGSAAEDKPATPPVRFLKLPPKKGDTWEVNSKCGNDTIKGTLKAGEETVSVPAGKYEALTSSCDKMSAGGTDIALTYYFAQNVGVVRQVIEAGGQKVVFELDKFEPAGKKQ